MATYTDEEIQARLEDDKKLQRSVAVAFLRDLANRIETGQDEGMSGWIVAVERYVDADRCATTAIGMASADSLSMVGVPTIFAGNITDSYYHDDEDSRGVHYATDDTLQWLRDEVEAGRIMLDDA